MRCQPWVPRGNPKVVGVGEAPGREEEKLGLPFVGYSGQELDRMLVEAGLSRSSLCLTNVFLDRPPENNLNFWSVSKAEAWDYAKALGWKYTFPPIAQGKYILPHLCWELLRLRQEIISWKPNLVVAFGNTPLWALCGVTGIGKYRGTVLESTLIPGLKVLPTYHPAAVLRQWEWRTLVLADLIKARAEAEFPEIVYPKREIWIEPNIWDISRFIAKYLPCKVLSVDIELVGPFVSIVGLSPRPDLSLVVPFVNLDGMSYWAKPEDEVQAWELVNFAMQSLCDEIVMQNGIFDTMHLLVQGVVPRRYSRDTMFKHHALYPGVQKALGFMGSLYTTERAWKMLRPHVKRDSEKDEE